MVIVCTMQRPAGFALFGDQSLALLLRHLVAAEYYAEHSAFSKTSRDTDIPQVKLWPVQSYDSRVSQAEPCIKSSIARSFSKGHKEQE